MSIFKRMQKSFVSQIDNFMQQYDKKHPKSSSQRKEIQKHENISKSRDHKKAKQKKSSSISWPED